MNDAGRRLDRVLRLLIEGKGLSFIYSSLRKGKIRVNGRRANPGQLVREGDRISIMQELALPGQTPAISTGAPDDGMEATALAMLEPLIIAKSADLLVINKPRGMLTHGQGSLESLVRATMRQGVAASLSFRPGPLHRLDRNTSGILVFSLSIKGARDFTALLRERRISKRYLALVQGVLAAPAFWEDRLERDEASLLTRASENGKAARTSIVPLLVARDRCLASVAIGTGRTHQIRAQCGIHGHPLVGDAKYGGGQGGSYLLHAWILDFGQAVFESLPSRLEAPLAAADHSRLASIFGGVELDTALEVERGPGA